MELFYSKILLLSMAGVIVFASVYAFLLSRKGGSAAVEAGGNATDGGHGETEAADSTAGLDGLAGLAGLAGQGGQGGGRSPHMASPLILSRWSPLGGFVIALAASFALVSAVYFGIVLL